MNNLILFVNAFASYLLLFLLIVVLVVVAFICGAKLRKAKDAKAEGTEEMPANVGKKSEV